MDQRIIIAVDERMKGVKGISIRLYLLLLGLGLNTLDELFELSTVKVVLLTGFYVELFC